MVDYVVIPAHNEEKNISNVIKEVKTFNLNIVVIDDGSKDKTYEEAKSQNVVVLRPQSLYFKNVSNHALVF